MNDGVYGISVVTCMVGSLTRSDYTWLEIVLGRSDILAWSDETIPQRQVGVLGPPYCRVSPNGIASGNAKT